jgi:bacteriocin-like protein
MKTEEIKNTEPTEQTEETTENPAEELKDNELEKITGGASPLYQKYR